jgi:hypothetical protein
MMKLTKLLSEYGVELYSILVSKDKEAIKDQIAEGVMLAGHEKVIEAALKAAYSGKQYRARTRGDRPVTKTEIISDAVKHLVDSGQIDFEEMIKLVDERA